MKERIDDKIAEIRRYLEELDSIKPATLEEYTNDIKEKAACERYVEKIMEAVTDLAFFIIKFKRLETPEDDQSAFSILANDGIITKEVFEKLRDAKGMKNIISHQYGKIDDEVVFEAITTELEKDINLFLKKLMN